MKKEWKEGRMEERDLGVVMISWKNRGKIEK